MQAYLPLRAANIGKPPNLLNPPADAPPEVRRAGIVPIIGAIKVEHVVDNCAADRVLLSRTEWYSLLRAAAPIEQHI